MKRCKNSACSRNIFQVACAHRNFTSAWFSSSRTHCLRRFHTQRAFTLELWLCGSIIVLLPERCNMKLSRYCSRILKKLSVSAILFRSALLWFQFIKAECFSEWQRLGTDLAKKRKRMIGIEK